MYNTTTNDNTAGGYYTNPGVGGYWYPAQPNVCPGCGRCRTCGQPNYPYQPVPYWPVPYWIPTYPTWTIT